MLSVLFDNNCIIFNLLHQIQATNLPKIIIDHEKHSLACMAVYRMVGVFKEGIPGKLVFIGFAHAPYTFLIKTASFSIGCIGFKLQTYKKVLVS
jgi:hypothetical protein